MVPAIISVERKGRQIRNRLVIVMMIFAFCYAGITGKLFWYANMDLPERNILPPSASAARPDIVDRNGLVLAMDVPSVSIYAEPRRMVDVDEAVEAIAAVFPDTNRMAMRQRLQRDSAFAWVRRTATPEQKRQLMSFGVPGIGFRSEIRRFYPNGSAAAHVLGSTNVDNIGIAGIERWIDGQGLSDLRRAGMQFGREDLDKIELSIDLRVQHAVADELAKAMEKFDAVAAAGLVLDVTNGEVVSLPDFDPNTAGDALKPESINRVNVGTYEMGSTLKAMTTAMALESGRFHINSELDASRPVRFGRNVIRDYRGQNRSLNVPEAFVHSSNIAMVKMALEVGRDNHREFLRSLGQLERLTTELPESASPIVPARWTDVTTATASFGHGVAVTPLQASVGVAALVNGGDLIRPTFVRGTDIGGRVMRNAVISGATGESLRFLMRLNAIVGSARSAEVDGYFIGGKTGTSEKVVNGRYSGEQVLTAFMGIAPAHDPKYLFLTVLDEPKGLPETHGFRTSGWNAVPATGAIMKRALPMLLPPSMQEPSNPFASMVAAGAWGSQHFVPGRFLAQNALGQDG